jgi:sigma-B regulation protein RsbU (phosphoserine phosphatase)
MSFDGPEGLQDLLLDLQQVRQEASDERRLRQALIKGLEIIAAPRSPTEMTEEMLAILRETVDFDHAVLLVAQDDGTLGVWFSTTERFEGTTWTPGPLFSRVLDGAVVPAFDVGQVSEWVAQPASVREGVVSAIHVGIRGGDYRTLLMCTHRSRGYFTGSHVRLLEGFAPLASQAMQNAWAHELERRGQEEEAARRIAESRLEILDHAMDSIGVGVAIWSPTRGLIQTSPVLSAMAEEFGGTDSLWQDVEPALRDAESTRCERCGDATASGTVRVTAGRGEGAKALLVTPAGHLDDPAQGVCLGEVVLVSDVSDRERLARDLEALSRLPATNPSPILRADHDGIVRFANPAARPLLRQWSVEVGDPLPDSVRAGVRQALQSGASSHVDALFADQAFDLLIVSVPGSNVVHIYGREVTEARAARLALEDSEARTRLLIEASLDAVVTMDDSGQVVDWSPRAEELFGWTEAEAAGKLMSEMIIPERLREAHERGLKEYLRTGEGAVIGARIEVMACHKSGEEIPVELFIRVLETGEGGSHLFAGFVRDVREQRRASNALTRANSRLTTLIESTAAGVVVEDESGQITLANEAFCQLFGIEEPPEDLQGSDANALLHGLAPSFTEPESHTAELDALRSGRKEGTSELIMTDGRIVEREHVPVRAGDEFMGHMWQYRDVTAYRKAEVAIRESRIQEVKLGREIQDLFLRGRPPEEHPAVDIAVLSTPSSGLDGDFVDFIEHGDNVLDVLVGDVMGKGIPASLLGAATKSSFSRALARARPQADGLPSPGTVMKFVHDSLAERLIAVESFVTMVFTRFDFEAQQLVFVDCGHPKTIHYVARTRECRRLAGSDPPLGFMYRNDYRAHRSHFEPGDMFVLYSDGITEAFSAEGEMFGEERLVEAVRQHAGKPPAEVVRAIRRIVDDFSAGAYSRIDDLTLVVVGVRHSWDPRAEAPLLERRMVVPRDSRRLVEFRALVDDFVREAFGLVPPNVVAEVKRAGQEAITNAMRHSQPEDPASPVEVRMEALPSRVILEIRYYGIEFEPSAAELPDVSTYPEGGFGLFIIDQSMDEVRYGVAADGRNFIRMVKDLG